MFHTIACGVDGSPSAENALTVAAGLARTSGGRLVLLHVQEVTMSRAGFLAAEDATATVAGLHRTARRLRDEGIDATVRCSRAAIRDTPRRLVELAGRAGADVLVVGNGGHGPVASLVLGSVAARLLRLATCPVILVPAQSPGGTPSGQPEVAAPVGERARRARRPVTERSV
ncbi:universal stress protein [Plantactinospora sp. BB1]|uniref:universal stress protein n=1 Tax=Plantactinospora sp. BB1 TaxID=2071627 RepID=UPI00131EE649|nr:universal stress protein [Plantactinospora sp. BB1]